MLHNLMLCNRAVTLTAGDGATLLTVNYPADISATETVLYDAGSASKYPLQVRAYKGAGGADIKIKLQGASLPIGGACFATRGAGGQQGLCQIWGVTGDLYRVRLAQAVGINQPFSSATSGTIGLDLSLVVTLPTDANGAPSGTPATLATYVNGLAGGHWSAVASGYTTGILGSTLDPRFAGRIHWGDIVSEIGGTTAIEHTISATAGSFVDVVANAMPKNLVAIRVLAKAAAAPAAGDSIQVLAAVEGQ